MVMAHINSLYPRVEIGSTAYLYSAEGSLAAPEVGDLW
ncbi:ErfK/YbiS/YcfS/YnhG family protein [Oceaniovalibus guishaninsula JLT2003]|nr:ErfK/YbiS/YcfS/YnhG family protein [Oceaniovalibus guishaninsula JLT2003]